MALTTYRLFPLLSPKPKATVYCLDVFGQPFTQEVRLGCHGRIEVKNLAGNAKGMGPSPFVAYSTPPGRKLMAMERTDYYSRWLLILDGWGHIKPSGITRGVYSDPSLVRPLDLQLDEYVESSGVKVLGDYRDLSQPDYLIRQFNV